VGIEGRVESLLVEFHRFGPSERGIQPGERYIRTSGWDAPAVEVTTQLDQYQFLKTLNRLRYRRGVAPDQVGAALDLLSTHAGAMLPEVAAREPGDLVQIDLVSNAAELWAFPFEACCREGEPWFASRDRPVVLTRRIRGEAAPLPAAWPARPRVLFVHAPRAADLPQALIDDHVAALSRALRPWAPKGPGSEPLAVREAWGPADFAAARGDTRFTHVHVLAHGAAIPDPDVPGYARWGVRLGPPGGTAVPPEDLVPFLRPVDGLPVVVTLAACDLGNEADSGMPSRSFAQELHVGGVPVVLASQLPLTQPGSVVLTEAFYTPLLRGEDVRVALHETRVALHERAADAGHDWVSLVAYVRLPEDYASHLMEVGLRAELGMLDAAQRLADALSATPAADDAQFDEIEDLVRQRVASLAARRRTIDAGRRGLAEECEGLLASAHKRLAEMLFSRARRGGPDAARHAASSRATLACALAHYRRAYESNVHHHWTGIQQLALEAALEGAIRRPADWQTVVRAAELDRDRPCEAREWMPACWACGTLAEAHLLAPLAGQPPGLDDARRAIDRLLALVPDDDRFPIDSTRRQLRRYVDWWTRANGFFQGRSDLAADAAVLLQAFG
jgi:hypothetical protein